MSGGLYEKLAQVELAWQEAEFLHAQFALGKPLCELFLGERSAGVLFHVGLADQSSFYGGMLCHSGVFGGEGEDPVHGFEKLFRVRVGHANFFRGVFAQLAGNVSEALRGRILLAEGKRIK